MQLLIFIIIYPAIWLLSRLPMAVLYIISDILYTIIYYIVGYRKKVVFQNIQLAFPDKNDSEIKTISKHFFRHLTDLMVESVKAFSISKKEISKRYTYKNPEVINDLTKGGKNVILVGAHYSNWEWSFSFPFVLETQMYGAYTKIANKYFDKVIKDSRTRFGVKGFKTSATIRGINSNIENNIQAIYLLLSDQSPQFHKTHYWQKFLGVHVPIHTGAEMLAKKFDFAVVNYSVNKIKRGYFETEFELITDNPRSLSDYEVTDLYLKITERNIIAKPEHYLWSHKRFKHKDRYNEWLEIRKDKA